MVLSFFQELRFASRALAKHRGDAAVAAFTTHDPVTFAGAVLALTAVSTLATYLPARRAAAIDPLEAVRTEA